MSDLFPIPLKSANSIPRSFSSSLELPNYTRCFYIILDLFYFSFAAATPFCHIYSLYFSFLPSLFFFFAYLLSLFSSSPFRPFHLFYPFPFFLFSSLFLFRDLFSVSRFNEVIKHTCDFVSYVVRICSLLIIPHLYCACISTLHLAFWCSAAYNSS